ncbi:MAG: hypothetical protein WCF54_14785 [Terracidiphilus sp.]
MTNDQKPEISIPEEAVGRGPILMGELRSENYRIPSVLVQFQKINPSRRKARIYLLTTVEQSKKLEIEHGPLSFEGSFRSHDGVTEYLSASDIWLKPITQINNKEAIYLAQTSGQIGVLKTREVYDNGLYQNQKKEVPYAWFVTDHCFLLQVIANQEQDEKGEAKKYGFSREDIVLSLSDGATAEVRRYIRSYRPSIMRDTKKMGYSIHVRNYKKASKVKDDVDALLLLASFASRERAISVHWMEDSIRGESVRYWQFNWERFPKRDHSEEPLLLRDHETCRDFIQIAFNTYNNLHHKELLNAAIYALLAKHLTLEIRFARLFTGIQSALTFALQKSKSPRQYKIFELHKEFFIRNTVVYNDLWPLTEASAGLSLSQIRNSIVHGSPIPDKNIRALSIATENLNWHLERIVLIALGWDVEKSAVSPHFLNRYFGYHWQKEQENFKI